MACLVQNSATVDSSAAAGNWSPLYGGPAKLDQDTIKYIHKFYCKDCRMEAERAKAAKSGSEEGSKPTSPQRSLDEASLHQTMDKNKESLKRKLMLRRSVNELVDQGIYPPLKTPPAFAEQRKQLERAKTGDLLRHKIQSRPDRQALVQQHILEDTNVDPSLQDRRRALKRARLLDGLNDKLFHRPGPLELVQGNILHADEKLAEAVKDGTIRFSRTFDMEDSSEQSEQMGVEEDSNQSDSAPSPSLGEDSSMSDISSPNSIIPTVPDISMLLQTQQKTVTPGQSLSFNKIPPITTQSFLGPASGSSIFANSSIQSGSKNNNGGNGNKSSSSSGSRHKKHKPKIQAKAKVIKFHEYKGPPNVVKTQPAAPSPPNPNSETPYHVMLQQQQLFLQWQLEFKQKNMPFTLSNAKAGPDGTSVGMPQSSPSSMINSSDNSQSCSVNSVSSPPPAPPLPGQLPKQVQFHQPSSPLTQIQKSPSPQPVVPPPPPPPPPASKQKSQNSASSNSGAPKSFSTFDEMKVADLKVELKKRNLPVSGPKPQLIERLRPFADSILTAAQSADSTTEPVTAPVVSTLPSVSAVVKVESNLRMEPPVKVEPSIKIEPGVQQEESMNTGSPPISPTHTEASVTPMSPDGMDIQSPSNVALGVLKSQFSSSQGSIPMIVDQISRPPSAAPMEIAPMETDQTSIIHSVADFTQSLPSGFKTFTAVAQPMPLTTPLLNNPQISPKQDQRQLTQEELLRQQQKKIEELQRQLQQSQLQLKIHQEQQRLLQQQKLLQQQVQQHQQQLAKHQTLQKLQLQKQQQQKQQLQQQQSPKQVQHVQSPPLVQTQSTPQTSTSVPSPQSPPQGVSTIQISIVDSSKVPQLQRGVSGAQQIQIPVHLLQAGQALQNSTSALPAVIVSSTGNSPTKQAKPAVTQAQAVVVPDLNLGKPRVSFATPPPNGQPFIFSSTADTSTKTTSEPMPPNGITRTTSLPGSPMDGQKISRSPSNPFFTIPLKEPPKYDEAIKSKQHQNQSQNPPFLVLETPSLDSPSTVSALAPKSTAIDDVLEILIRNGELPPSAAQEPPPTPKTTTSSGTAPAETTTVSLSMDAMLGSASSPKFSQLSPHGPFVGETGTSTVTTLHTPVASPLSTGQRESSPHPFLISPPPSNENPTHELSLSEQDGLPPHLDLDFSNMDWSSDPALGLDLADSAGLSIDPSRFVVDGGKMLSVPVSSASPRKSGSSHGSEPDLAALGLNDPECNSHMQMDVSDWLDVIMPSTGLTPLSTNAPVSFPSDPILTPKTQQEVLDLFNFDEAEFTTTEPQGGINWDKLTEPSTSAS